MPTRSMRKNCRWDNRGKRAVTGGGATIRKKNCAGVKEFAPALRVTDEAEKFPLKRQKKIRKAKRLPQETASCAEVCLHY